MEGFEQGQLLQGKMSLQVFIEVEATSFPEIRSIACVSTLFSLTGMTRLYYHSQLSSTPGPGPALESFSTGFRQPRASFSNHMTGQFHHPLPQNLIHTAPLFCL